MSESLHQVLKNDSIALYQEKSLSSTLLNIFIASTPQTRAITNDPFVYGVDYTSKLSEACASVFKYGYHNFQELISGTCHEKSSTVLNILRGGLNFGLREALSKALGWNAHSAAFISAQRARNSENPEEWHITESSYQKVYLPKDACIVFGDVVATGTSLEYALNQILDIAKKEGQSISSFIFFTIGGPRSHEILEVISKKAKQIFPNFSASIVIYLEGCFSVAETDTPVSIKYTGTDLLRSNSILSPEFLNSQSQNPAFPIERCTIYDAGSRSFWVSEYFEDVLDYWEKTKALSGKMSYLDLLKERFPEYLEYADQKGLSLNDLDLKSICEKQISTIEKILS